MCSPPSPTRSRTRGHRTATAPMPVMISRSGRCPWRTSRRRPSSVNLSVWVRSQAATSASTACPNSVLAPLRKTSVSGSENVPGWVSWKTLVSVMAYHSFGGEVEALNTPTIRRLTLPCRHQLSALARRGFVGSRGISDQHAVHGLNGSKAFLRADSLPRRRRQIKFIPASVEDHNMRGITRLLAPAVIDVVLPDRVVPQPFVFGALDIHRDEVVDMLVRVRSAMAGVIEKAERAGPGVVQFAGI